MTAKSTDDSSTVSIDFKVVRDGQTVVLDDVLFNAKSTDDKNILNMVAVAGGIEWLKNVKSTGKVDKRENTTNNLDKAQDKKNEKLSFAEYRKMKAERKNKVNK